jgi:hypothetical protein
LFNIDTKSKGEKMENKENTTKVDADKVNYNTDEDGMNYFGMFTEIDGKVVYQTCGEL